MTRMAWGGRKYDAIVIGGDLNGLAAAAYLGRAHQRVLVLEESATLGGVAVTGEIMPDYSVSTVAHLVEALPRSVERDLKLARHGLRMAARDMPTVALDRDGEHLVVPRNRKDIAALAVAQPKDAAAWRAFDRRMKAHAALLAPLLLDDAAPAASSLRRLVWRAGWNRADRLVDLLHLLPQSVGDLLDAEFEYPLLKGALALDAVLGGADGPYSPGTVLRLLHRIAMRSLGRGLSVPVGGLGAATDALAAAVAAERGEIRTGVRVSRLMVEGGAVAGVETSDGVAIVAPLVVSSLDPRFTMLELLGAAHIETEEARRLARAPRAGSVAKVNLALDGLPEFRGLAPAMCGARLLVAPSLDAVDHVATDFGQRALASEPVMEITIPSVVDPALAPAGHHVMSVLVPFMPHDVEGGWPARRDEFMQRVTKTIAQYSPDFPDRLIAGDVLTPPDIETRFGLPGGDWYCGGARVADLPGPRGPATPVSGLWLCGPGTHAASGVTGLPGRDMAAAFAAERGRR
ncbi:MAG: NAD(P)/FAD-dependent oxidoreductase [Parvibaculum sp.]|nr:NAD(P)/FAD-dependent oxidoreductase [Parvibaculum sp.]